MIPTLEGDGKTKNANKIHMPTHPSLTLMQKLQLLSAKEVLQAMRLYPNRASRTGGYLSMSRLVCLVWVFLMMCALY
jgi:hypothetical protein